MSETTITWCPVAGRARKNLTGQRIGRRVITGPGRNVTGIAGWCWRCDCGREGVGTTQNVRKSPSCGCLQRETATTHGKTLTGTFLSWKSMKARCRNPRVPDYPRYGGRGITVCDRWYESFDAFLADMGDRPDGLTLDRIDNDRGYEPGNCRWATKSDQSRNRRERQRDRSGRYA